MKHTIILVLITFLSFSTVSAQKKVMEKLRASAERFKSKPLAVVLKSEKKEEFRRYNQYIQEALNSEWDLNQGVEFFTEEEFKSIRKDKNSNYAYLRYQDNTLKNMQKDLKDQNTFNEAIYFGTVEDKTSFHKEPFILDENTSLMDVFLTVQHARNIIDKLSEYEFKKMSKKDIKAIYAKQAEVSKILKKETLYINKNLIKKGFEDTINKMYKYEYEIVDEKIIETAILNNYEDFYYLTKGTVVNADTGEIVLTFIPPKSGLQIATPVDGFKTDKITEKDFKNLVMYLN